MGPAAMIASETGGIPGHITALGHEPQHYTIFYVSVDDVTGYLEKAKALGAKALVGPIDIPTGTFAWMQDPKATPSAYGGLKRKTRRRFAGQPVGNGPTSLAFAARACHRGL
ncbi:MAG TPA: hypothetical protein VF740_13960 [Candidatus Acidoferrum sp.]